MEFFIEVDREPLVSISEACQTIGVSETALRQWTDEGKIKVYLTPGGHRRYLMSDLKRFMAVRKNPKGMKDLVVGLEEAETPLRDVARKCLAARPWYNRLDPVSQLRLANLGRNMLEVIIKYAAEPARRDDAIKTAREIGAGFGETLAQIDLPLTDSIEAFILHRDPIIGAATSLIKSGDLFKGKVVDSIPMVARVMDEALISLVASYQLFRNSSGNETKRVANE